MVLYCVQHSGCIVKAIVHKFKYHPDDEALFLTDCGGCPDIDKIKYCRTPDPMDIVRHSARSCEEIKKYTNAKIGDFFREAGIEPLKFSRTYVMSEEYNPFILYFELNSIEYISVEAASGAFADYGSGRATARLMSLHPECFAYNCLIRDMHLQDANGEHCVKAQLYSEGSACDTIPGKADAEVFGYREALMALGSEQKRQLLAGFNAEQYDFDTVLLLSRPSYIKNAFAIYKGEMPFGHKGEGLSGRAARFYKTLIDYYFSDTDFAVKMHPASEEGFAEYFSDFKRLPAEFPEELLLLLDRQVNVVCPDLPADCELLRDNAEVFGSSVFGFFRYIHFVFLALTVISALGLPEKITVSGIDMLQLEHFRNHAFKDLKDTVLQQLSRDNAGDADYVIADPSADFAEIIEQVGEDCLIFVYGAYPAAPDHFVGQEMLCTLSGMSDGEEQKRFSWTVLSKNRGLIDAVKGFDASYSLDGAGITVQSRPLS